MDLIKEKKREINSLTKFPHIPTFHVMGRKELTEEVTPFPLGWSYEELFITEKFDGANARMIFLPDGEILIGSRNDLLTCVGDKVWDESYSIVDTLTPIALRVASEVYLEAFPGNIVVLYGEVYGVKNLQAWKNYGDGEPKFRLFDMAQFSSQRLEEPIERIAAWRERGEQSWYHERGLKDMAERLGLSRTTRLGTVSAADLPTSIEDTRAWMEPFKLTTESYGPGLSEGVVLSDRFRRTRLKLRFEDYDKVINRRKEEIRLAEKNARKESARMANR